MLNSMKQFIDEIRPKTVCSGVVTAVIGPSLGSVSITGGPVIQNVHIPPTAAQGDRVTLYRDQGGVWHIVGTESKPSVPVSAQTANDIVGLITYKPALTVTVTSGVTNLVWSTWPDFVGAFELQSSNISDAGHSDATTLAIVNGSTLSLLNLTADRWFRVRAVTRLFVRSAWSDWTAASPLAPIPAPTDTDQILYSADGMVWSLATWADLTSNFGSGGSSNFDELRIGDDPYTYIGSSARNIWGVESRYGNDYTILGVRHLADDRSDTVLLVGDNAESDLFWLVFYDHEGTEYSMLEVGADHARFLVDTTIEGQLAVQDGLSLTGALSLTGDISMSSGALVDGIDLSAHAASDSAHHAPVTLTAAADSLLSLSTQAIDLDTQAANLVLAGPTGGAAATPTMRGLVFADIPSSSNPGAAAAVLATNTSGQVQLTGLGIGIDPRYNVGIRSQPTFNYVNVWLYGISNVLQHAPVSDGYTILIGYENKVIVTGTANNSGALYSARQSIGWQSSGAITAVVGEYIRVDENYGYIGTIYGVMIHDIAQGSYGAAWSLYSTDANAPSYFAGNLLIGTTDSTGLGSSGGLKIASNFIHTGTVFESGDTTPKFGSYTLTIPATGTVALGTGTNTYLAFWSGTNTLSSTSALTWDGSQLTVGNDLYMTGAGWVGLGTTPVVGRRVVIAVSATDPAYTIRGMSCVATGTYTSDSAQLLYAQTNNTNLGVSSTKTHSSLVMGVTSTVSLTSTFAGTQSGAVHGIYNALTCAAGAAGTVSGAAYVYTSVISFGAGTTAWSAIYGYFQATWDSAAMNGNTVANAYGIYLGSISAGTTQNYAIYTNAGKVRFGDNVLIGTSTDGMTANGSLAIAQDLAHRGSKAGFFNAAPVTKPAVTGSRGGNAALASLLTALAGLGLLTDSSTA